MLIRFGNLLIGPDALGADLRSVRFVPKGTPVPDWTSLTMRPPMVPSPKAALTLTFRDRLLTVAGANIETRPSTLYLEGDDAEAIWAYLCDKATTPRREPLL